MWLRAEEQAFDQTLEQGTRILDEHIARARRTRATRGSAPSRRSSSTTPTASRSSSPSSSRPSRGSASTRGLRGPDGGAAHRARAARGAATRDAERERIRAFAESAAPPTTFTGYERTEQATAVGAVDVARTGASCSSSSSRRSTHRRRRRARAGRLPDARRRDRRPRRHRRRDEVPRGDGRRVGDLAAPDHRLELGDREARAAQVLLGRLGRGRPGFESRREPHVEALVEHPVGEEERPQPLDRAARRPVSSASSPRASSSAGASGASSQAPCGSSQKRRRTGWRYCSTSHTPSPSSGTITRARRLLHPGVQAGRAVGRSSRSSCSRIQRFS